MPAVYIADYSFLYPSNAEGSTSPWPDGVEIGSAVAQVSDRMFVDGRFAPSIFVGGQWGRVEVRQGDSFSGSSGERCLARWFPPPYLHQGLTDTAGVYPSSSPNGFWVQGAKPSAQDTVDGLGPFYYAMGFVLEKAGSNVGIDRDHVWHETGHAPNTTVPGRLVYNSNPSTSSAAISGFANGTQVLAFQAQQHLRFNVQAGGAAGRLDFDMLSGQVWMTGTPGVSNWQSNYEIHQAWNDIAGAITFNVPHGLILEVSKWSVDADAYFKIHLNRNGAGWEEIFDSRSTAVTVNTRGSATGNKPTLQYMVSGATSQVFVGTRVQLPQYMQHGSYRVGANAGTRWYYDAGLRRFDSMAAAKATYIAPYNEGVAGSTAPTCTTNPVLSGTATEGQTITWSTGTWTGSPTSFAYQVLRNGSVLADSGSFTTTGSYVLTSADVNASIVVRVTATNAAGTGQADTNTFATIASLTQPRFFGKNTVGTGIFGPTANTKRLNRWTLALGPNETHARCTKIWAHLTGQATGLTANHRYGIYGPIVSGNLAAAPLAATATPRSLSGSAGPQWYDFTLPENTDLAAGEYAIAEQTDTANVMWISTATVAGAQYYDNSDSYADGLEATVGTTVIADREFSMYVEFTPVVTGAGADTTPPVFQSATVDGATLTLLFNETLDAASLPGIGDFSVVVAGISRGTSNVSISGSSVIVTLASAVSAGQVTTVAYTPSAIPIQDTAGNDVAAFGAQSVTNITAVTDATAPALVSARVNGSSLVLTFDEPLDTGSVPATTDFAVTVAGVSRSVTARAISGNTITLTLASAVLFSQAVVVSYTPPGSGKLRDAAANNVVAISSQAVTNVTADSSPPVLSDISINNRVITALYDEPLDPTSVPAVGDFTAVINGVSFFPVSDVAIAGQSLIVTLSGGANRRDVVVFDYVPGVNPVQDLAGNEADNLSNRTVRNVTPTVSVISIGGRVVAPERRIIDPSRRIVRSI